MKKFLAVLALTFAVALVLPAHEAGAADVWKVSLTSTDGGTSNSGTIGAKLSYSIQCPNPACYRTGTSTLTADCTKDFILEGQATTLGAINMTDAGAGHLDYSITTSYIQPTRFTRDFESGAETKIAARALDGGDPACQVYQRTR